MICGHASAAFDETLRMATCTICGASAPGRYLIGVDGGITGFRVEAWVSPAWLDNPPRIFVEPRAEA